MIKVIAARGSYGHHLSNILVTGTNLTKIDKFFQLSATGDTHSIRSSTEAYEGVIRLHFRHLIVPPQVGEQFVLIEPSRDHILDYISNSFSKESNYNFNDWFLQRMINKEAIPEEYFSDILRFLNENQIFTSDARAIAPKNFPWMIREFLSYRIDQIMFTCYERYFMLTYHSKIKSTDFFDNFEPALTELVNRLGLKFKMPMADIVAHNQTFVKHQPFHGMQKRCDQFVESTINKNYMENPCISIFDEAYVQSKLRNAGWEIKIDNLNKFPNAVALAELIYPADLKQS